MRVVKTSTVVQIRQIEKLLIFLAVVMVTVVGKLRVRVVDMFAELVVVVLFLEVKVLVQNPANAAQVVGNEVARQKFAVRVGDEPTAVERNALQFQVAVYIFAVYERTLVNEARTVAFESGVLASVGKINIIYQNIITAADFSWQIQVIITNIETVLNGR